MASIISAGTTSNTALNLSADTTGVLQLATNGSTTAMTITTGQLVGIGTASPTHRLQVEGNSGAEVKVTRGTNSFVISLSNNIGGDVYVGTSVASALLFQTDNTERMRITSGGNVGIGTSSPAIKLEVNGTGELLRLDGSGNQNRQIYLRNVGTGTAKVFTDGTMTIGSNDVYPLTFITSDTERMRITSGGNVGIGQSSPSCRFDVTDSVSSRLINFNSTGANGPGIGLSNSGTDFAYFGSNKWALGGNLTDYGQVAVNNFIFGAGNTERMRISSSGNVGIGTTNPTFKLQINVAAGADALNITDALTSDFQVKPGVSTGVCRVGPSAGAIAFQTDGSERMRIASGGNAIFNRTTVVNAATIVCAATQNTRQMSFVNNSNNNEVGFIFCENSGTSTQYSTTSDYRLKENIAPMTGALAKVQQLKPCTYTWKINGSAGQGFIAHELQEVIPEAVCGEKDAVNENGSIMPQGVDTSFLVATLTAAIQELKAELDATKAEVAALKGVN